MTLEAAGELPPTIPVANKKPCGVPYTPLLGDKAFAGWPLKELNREDRCHTCGGETEAGGLVQCDGCELSFHRRCLAATVVPQRRGPWYCQLCKFKYSEAGLTDLTLDDPLLRYLAIGEVPPDAGVRERVERAAQYVEMDGMGIIWLKATKNMPSRCIPPIGRRERIAKRAFREGVFPSGDRLYEVLRIQYFWTGMRADCRSLAATSLVRQMESAKFLSPPYLFPTSKGTRPFMVWSVDSVPKMKPRAPHGGDCIVIAICVFSKWVEIGAPPSLQSKDTADWFYQEVVCRYGCPYAVRTD